MRLTEKEDEKRQWGRRSTNCKKTFFSGSSFNGWEWIHATCILKNKGQRPFSSTRAVRVFWHFLPKIEYWVTLVRPLGRLNMSTGDPSCTLIFSKWVLQTLIKPTNGLLKQQNAFKYRTSKTTFYNDQPRNSFFKPYLLKYLILFFFKKCKNHKNFQNDW